MTDERTDQDQIALEKRAVRAAVRAGIGAIPPAQRALASACVCLRVTATRAFARARVVMLFAPLPDEVDLTPVLQRCRETGRRVCVARANWETRIMEPAEVGGRLWEALAPARYGVREPPAAAPLLPLEEIDLVLVPAVAFDTGCHRLGRGGGFYDRFLARAELRRAFLLGVGFGVQLVASVPRAEHDRPVDAVVTDADLVVRRNTT